MPAGVTRILPFAAISAALHAAVLVNAPERLEIAVTPGGHTKAVAVRLVPAGATTPTPAAQSGVAGSKPEPIRERNEQSEPTPKAANADKVDAAESRRVEEPEGTEPDLIQATSTDQTATEAAPKDTDQKTAETVPAEKNESSDESGTTPDTAEESAKASAAAKTDTTDTPNSPKAPHASEADETRRSVQADEARATHAAVEAAEATGPDTKPDENEATEDDSKAAKQSGAEGADDRAQLASHARQQVEIHFRDRFRYPRIARQRGWEGRVVLSFRLQPDGRITDVEVTETSGRSILDENARQTLIHIQRVPELADQLGREPLELEVPVTYRLQPA